jgi:ribA/ribD-fused uncharacterized protein
MAIKEFQGEHRWLSNFWPAKVVIGGIVYPSVENAYQAAKTLNLEQRKRFAACTAGQAKRLGKTVDMRNDWESVKLQIMLDLVRQKFYVHLELRNKLLATGEEHIEEGNKWNDQFWGVCRGKGQNHLGKIIMDVRASLFSDVERWKRNKSNNPH